MKRLKALSIVLGLALLVFALCWWADFSNIRQMGGVAFAFALGSSVLGFLMMEFDGAREGKPKKGRKDGGHWRFRAAYAAAVIIAYVAIEWGAPQAAPAARLFVLFLAIPFLAGYAARNLKI